MSKNAVILYGRWERPRSTGLFGLTWGATIFAGSVIVGSVLTWVVTQSMIAGLVLLSAGAIALGPMVFRAKGRSGWELVVLRFQFWSARRRGETRFRGGVFGVVPGAARMPGIQGESRLYEYELRNGQRFALIHSRAVKHFTVVLSTQPQGQERVEQWQINEWVAGWDRFLAHLGTMQGLAGAVVVVETVPDNGYRIASEVRALVADDAPAYARQVMAETATHRASATVRNEVRIALTFSPQRTAESSDVGDQGAAIGRQLSTLIGHAAQAGLDATPMTAGDLCVIGARAYRPELTGELETLAGRGDQDSLSWDGIGPTGAEAHWDRFVHNGFQSVTWEMATAPAGAVAHDTLLPLLAPRASLSRKRVAIVYRVHNIGDAVRMVDSDFKDALAAEQSKTGIGSAAASLRVDNTKAARQEQARGAGLTRFGMLITVTSALDDDAPTIAAELEGLASASRLGVQRVFGGQDAAFAGALGLGVLLPEHESISRRIAS